MDKGKRTLDAGDKAYRHTQDVSSSQTLKANNMIIDHMRHACEVTNKGKSNEDVSSLSEASQRIKDYMRNACNIVEDIQSNNIEIHKVKSFSDSLKKAISIKSSEARNNSYSRIINKTKSIVETTREKMDNLASHPQPWQYTFVEATKIFLNECHQATKGKGMRQCETRINGLNDEFEQISKGLDKWRQVYEAQEKLEKVLNDIPQKYRSLANKMAQKDQKIAENDYSLILRDYKEKTTNPSYQENSAKAMLRFDTVCDSLVSRPNQLQDVYQKQKSFTSVSELINERHDAFLTFMRERLPEVKSHNNRTFLIEEVGQKYRDTWSKYEQDRERWEEDKTLNSDEKQKNIEQYNKAFGDVNTKFQSKLSEEGIQHCSVHEEWIEHEKSKDYLLACLGKIDGQSLDGLKHYQKISPAFNKYRKHTEALDEEYSNSRQEENLDKARTCVDKLKAANLAFETFLKKCKLLERL
jgi:hypothetical protein